MLELELELELEIGALSNGIAAQKISVSRASRIVAALNSVNAKELIEFAANLTQREIDQKVAEVGNQQNERRENLKISAEVVEFLRQAQAVMARRKKSPLKLDETLKLVLEEFLERHEPVRKAERAKQREQSQSQKRKHKSAAELAATAQPPSSVCTENKTRHQRKSVPARVRHITSIP